MAWARLDDGFGFHPKVLAAGNAAVGVWIRALTHCAAHATGGFASAEIARHLGTTDELDALTSAGLWRPVVAGETHTVTGRRDATGRRRLEDAKLVMPGDGYLIPDFLRFHPTRNEAARLREDRQRAAIASHEARKSTAPADADAKQVHVQVQTQPPASAQASALQSGVPPDPTRPEPKDLPHPTAPSRAKPGRAGGQDHHNGRPNDATIELLGGTVADVYHGLQGAAT